MPNEIHESQTQNIVDTIKNIFFKPPTSQFLKKISEVDDEEVFKHPFCNNEKIDSEDDRPPEIIVQRVLRVGKKQDHDHSQDDTNNVTEPSSMNKGLCYLPIPHEVVVKLSEEFAKTQLSIKESKARINIDRRVSVGSSLNRRSISSAIGPVGRKESSASIGNRQVGLKIQNRRQSSGSSITMTHKRLRKIRFRMSNCPNKDTGARGISGSTVIKERAVMKKSSELKDSNDFVIQSVNARNNLNNPGGSINAEFLLDDDLDTRMQNKFVWSRKEKARRKVSNWLRRDHL